MKRCLALPYGQNDLGAPDRRFIEAHAPLDTDALLPRLSISFVRLTLLGRDINERVTFDRDVIVGGHPSSDLAS